MPLKQEEYFKPIMLLCLHFYESRYLRQNKRLRANPANGSDQANGGQSFSHPTLAYAQPTPQFEETRKPPARQAPVFPMKPLKPKGRVRTLLNDVTYNNKSEMCLFPSVSVMSVLDTLTKIEDVYSTARY